MNLNDREQYEAWFRIEYGQEPMPRTSPTHDFCWAGYKAGQESLRQQVAMLRDIMQEVLDDVWLKTSHELARKFSKALAATEQKS